MATSTSTTPQTVVHGTARWAMLASAVGLVVMAAVTVGFGAELGASVLVLSVAAVALVLSLRRLFLVVMSLGRGEAQALAQGRVAGQGLGATARRQEQRRVLKAIKELEFDHAMGKLSDADHERIAARYKLRAVELMRASDIDDASLHPLTQAALAGDQGPKVASGDARFPSNDAAGVAEMEAKGVAGVTGCAVRTLTVAGAPEPSSTAADATVVVCGSCEVANDLDARFCKGCGASLAGRAK